MDVLWLDLGLTLSLGFLGSFGHCVGMCGGLTVAFAHWHGATGAGDRWRFHGWLNLGRVLSYGLMGGLLGGLGGLAGEVHLRRGMGLLTGVLLILLGIHQVFPQFKLFLVGHPLRGAVWHDRFSGLMAGVSRAKGWWMPLAVGGLWGLIPCGFLYTAQIRAVESGSAVLGLMTMLAFGLGTVPALVVGGWWVGKLSADRRSQLFRAGGWITIAMGLLTLCRTEGMHDWTGYGSFILLMVVAIARPLAQVCPWMLVYRRFLGVSAFILSVIHAVAMVEHSWQWQWEAIEFLLPHYRVGVGVGVGAITLMTPSALTSFDGAMRYLGRWWRRLHLLGVGALVLGGGHIVLCGSHFLGAVEWGFWQYVGGGGGGGGDGVGFAGAVAMVMASF